MIKKLNGKTCGYIAAVAVLLLSFLLTGCGSDDTPKAENGKEKVTIALWGNDLLENYAPYLCRQFPDVEFDFGASVVASSDINYSSINHVLMSIATSSGCSFAIEIAFS